MKTQNKSTKSNRWHLSAEGFLLLPSALRPHLLGKKCKKSSYRDTFYDKIALNCAKNHQKLQFFAKINGKSAKNTQILAILALFQIVAMSTIFSHLCSTPVSAASLTLTIPSSFSLNITPGANGTFVKSESKSINVKTDNSSGYTLSIKAKNSDNGNSLLNGSSKLNSISEQTSEDNFRTNAKFNNTWGFLPSKFKNQDNSNFLPGPTIEESVLETTEEANESSTSYNITLGAKIDNTISSGSYNNNFVFSAIANEPKVTPMQDWDGCGDLSTNETIQLRDTRDNKIYQVAKLKDGKCWMVENLRLGDEKLSNRTLTSDNTDISDSTYQLTEQTPVDFNVGSNHDADVLYIDSNHPEYGGYYSWHTATAGTGTASMWSQGQNATSSICPKGWRLPTGGSSSDFNDLVTAYGGNNSTGSTNLRANPVPDFVYGGYVRNYGHGLADQGSEGSYWSSTNLVGDIAYVLHLSSSDADSTYYTDKYLGHSVRCVTEPKLMQTVYQWGEDVEGDEVVKAIDTRDGNTYTVSKLKDGKLWMTQNLRLGDDKIKTRELTPDDTDISENFTLPESDQDGANYPAVYAGDGKPRFYRTDDDSYGNYYNWYAATAGTGTVEQASGDAPSSICPSGWRLPTYAEIWTLTGKYYYDTASQPPANFVCSGACLSIGSCSGDQASVGYWWTSAASSAVKPYNLRLDCGDHYFNVYDICGKGAGLSVRCVAREPKKITDLQYLQDWNDLRDYEKTQVKNSMQDETNYTLKDKRDNNEYTIAKLKDGKVWMTQNLKLGDEKLTNRTLTSENTDISDSTYQLTEHTPVDFNQTNNGGNDADALYIDSNHPEYGGYYSWHTATAGTGTASMSSKGQNATSSICPKGWKLPTGGSSSEFNVLVAVYGGSNSTGSTNLRATPVPGFVYNGYVSNEGDDLADQGSGGFYWSSTVYNVDHAYLLYLLSSKPSPTTYGSKYYGLSIRCVAR